MTQTFILSYPWHFFKTCQWPKLSSPLVLFHLCCVCDGCSYHVWNHLQLQNSVCHHKTNIQTVNQKACSMKYHEAVQFRRNLHQVTQFWHPDCDWTIKQRMKDLWASTHTIWGEWVTQKFSMKFLNSLLLLCTNVKHSIPSFNVTLCGNQNQELNS